MLFRSNAYSATNVTITGGSFDQVNAGSFYQNSSRTLKQDIEDYKDSALELISKVNVVKFRYISDPTDVHIGFIAEDTPKELSTERQNTMDTASAIGILLKAVQELEERIKKLENEG